MFDFAKKLILARQLKMEKGRITLLKNPVTIISPGTIAYIMQVSRDKARTGREIYYGSKKSFKETFANYVKLNYKTKQRELIEIMINLAMMTGWGEWKLVKLKTGISSDIMRIKNSPIAEIIHKEGMKMDYPVDHMVRGFHAGAAEIIFNKKVDAVETKCMAKGDPFCELVLKPTEEWRKEKNVFMRGQLFPAL